MTGGSAFHEGVRRVAGGEGAGAVAGEIVAAMTLDERLGVLDGDTEFWAGMVDMVSGGYAQHPWPAAEVERLGVPGLRFADGPRGVVVGEATCFPVAMGRAATFDPGLEERVGDAIGRELRAAGATLFGGVCVNLLRHPGWGRAQETYGEDPHLLGEMGAALTRGVQAHAMACVKHFALNSMENARFTVDVTVDDRTLHEVYLPHFRRVVDEGVACVMTAYNAVNGDWCGESEPLVAGVLRGEWGFDGYVVTDFVFGLRDPVRSVLAGVDVEMPFRQLRAHALPGALEDGTLPAEAVGAAATRVVATLLRFADRITAPPPGPEVIASDEHRALAREVAQRSLVLLRNEPADEAGTPVLPLDAGTLRRVAVVGRLADQATLGDHGSSRVNPPAVVTALDGLRAALPGTEIVHVATDATDAATAAGEADVAIVVVGYDETDEGEFLDAEATAQLAHLFPPRPGAEPRPAAAPPTPGDDRPKAAPGGVGDGFLPGGDRRRLGLRKEDEAMVEAVAAANPRTVVVLIGGSAILVDPWHERVAAIVHAFYPGMEGGHALADVLLGHVEPSGRLPFAVPTDAGHLPDFDIDATAVTYDAWHGQWKLHRDGRPARYPFGFGLGYANAEIAAAAVRRKDVGDSEGDGIEVTVTVSNAGDRPAPEVVQVYAGGPPGGVERPSRRLVGFARTVVPPAGTTTTQLTIPLDRLAVRIDGAWALEPGDHPVAVALHAEDPGVATVVTL
jgi:beta-glucosidase-like glycosyl hydrolase